MLHDVRSWPTLRSSPVTALIKEVFPVPVCPNTAITMGGFISSAASSSQTISEVSENKGSWDGGGTQTLRPAGTCEPASGGGGKGPRGKLNGLFSPPESLSVVGNGISRGLDGGLDDEDDGGRGGSGGLWSTCGDRGGVGTTYPVKIKLIVYYSWY